jgi:cell division protein FtsB
VKRTWVVAGALATVAILFVAVFPARTYLDQRHQRQEVLARINATDSRNRVLEHRISTLHTDAEVERLAREQYNLVRPGEEAYAILPTRQSQAAAAHQPPPASHAGWLSRTWHSIASVF